jgi:methanethiol S-methyltransferase
MGRLLAIVFGGACYAFAMAVICYAVGFVGNLGPKSIDLGGHTGRPLEAAMINLSLLGIFAIQQSLMARPGFKALWTRMVPRSLERSTYVLFSSLALALLFWQWRPIDGVLWSAQGAVGALLTSSFWLGWALVFVSTFLISHFDLFGLAQVWALWRRIPQPVPDFRTPLLYRIVRHPIYLGFLLAFWATPRMTHGHALFAAAASAYILVGAWLEERDLVRAFGQAYRNYQARVPMLLPFPSRRKEAWK